MVYQHYKGGRYTKICTATNSTNNADGELMVVYVSHTTGRINVRGVTEFEEMIKWPDGVMRSRFVPLCILEPPSPTDRCEASFDFGRCIRPKGHAGKCSILFEE